MGPAPRGPGDPALAISGGTLARRDGSEQEVGGAGWADEAAQAACLGEAIERLAPAPARRDRLITASYAGWPLRDEPAVPPTAWVLFHPEQHAQPGFPFAPFGPHTECEWVAFRELLSGDPRWVPLELGYLQPGPRPHRIAPGVSTGLAAASTREQALLRGLQEVLERDALVGAWWGRYPLEPWPSAAVLAQLEGAAARVERPGLELAFWRIDTPWAGHVTVCAATRRDARGPLLALGSACRETRAASWEKSLLEALQGLPYVDRLREELRRGERPPPERLASFADHALYYTAHPERLGETPLGRAGGGVVPEPPAPGALERLPALAARLGPDRPVLWRIMTPPEVGWAHDDWHVLRVVVPGLQPLHGVAALAHLGGPLWAPRGLREHLAAPPHPFA